MTKAKFLFMSLLVGIILLIMPTIVSATDTFTTDDGITATKIVDNYKGNIQFKLTNIELNAEGNYVWGFGTTSKSADITSWYTLGDFTASQKVAYLDLAVSENSILSVLRSTNNAYLFVKNYDTDEMIVDGLNVDLTLPPYQAFTLMEYGEVINGGCYYVVGGEKCSVDRWKAATYNIENIYFKFEKVTDENLINSYNDALINGTSVDNVFNITTTQISNLTGWNLGTKDYYFYNQIPHASIPSEKGTYILYLKGKDTDTKTVYGYKVIQLDADGPTVEKIYVSSPESGTYKTGQTVKIRVGFSEPIVGSTVPTLKVKFGDSDVREISNGTIVNSGSGNYYWSHYIEYSYDIQDSDVGQLATVGLTGGNIKDSSGNEAVLSCPIITGNTIKANVDEGSGSNGGNDGEVKRETVKVEFYGLPLPEDCVASLKDGYLYYAEDSSKEQEKIEGVSNIKQLYVANLGTGVNKAILVVTEDGTVYRLNSEKQLVIYKELSKYKVSEIVKCEGEMKAVFTLLLTDFNCNC